ncbi:MAG: lysine 2,3-aminomutase [Bacteriovoracaceae bacterium]|nr:lysine 2,3-aminomutase [Bacteriovoracaceae bacterium]
MTSWKDLQKVADLEKVYPKHILDKFPISGKHQAYADVSDENWYDWKWQLKNRITNLEGLSKVIDLTEEEKSAFEKSNEKFKMAITPYYGALMDKTDPNCPVRLQSVPNMGELNVLETDLEDPLAEDKDMPVPGLTHRYPDRVLFYVSNDCPMLCRHCTRKRKVADENSTAGRKQIDGGLEYIRSNKQIRDVIVSGGDPLCLNNDLIDYILGELRKIEHVEIVRIGSRNQVTMAYRLFDDELIKILEKHQPIHINTHFNHPKEMTREALLASTRLALAGVTMGNQSVLLKGINDDALIMKEISHKLLLMRIRPYYIYQCDLSEGISHFRTSIDKGVEIIEKMRGWTSGLAIPQFVVDAPGGGGKIPVNPQYFVKRDGKKVVLRNYKKEEFTYYEP